MKRYKLLTVVFMLFISGCATPPEVKQLSVKQMGYFDAAISAVSTQSEAFIIMAERLVVEAKGRIDAEEQDNRSRLTKLIQQGGLSQDQAADVARRIADHSSQAVSAKEKLVNDFAVMQAKTKELNMYLAKMKQVHTAIDAYVQSEKVDEAVIHDFLNQLSVKTHVD